MGELKDESVKACVTSPPYFRGKKYEVQYDTFEEYRAYLRRTWREVLRVLEDNGLFFVNIGDSFDNQFKSHEVAKDIVNTGFNLVQTVIWVKGHHSPVQGRRHLNHLFEYVFIFSKTREYSLDRLNIGIPYKDKSNIGRWKIAKRDLRCRGDVWNINYETVQRHSQKLHDAIFPKELPSLCIKLSGCGRSDLVLDPFLGSGTTVLAAAELGVPSVGYEVNSEYENIIREKLRSVKGMKMKVLRSG
jgi:site-specific DNA-methyltransferase (adenine-specific)